MRSKTSCPFLSLMGLIVCVGTGCSEGIEDSTNQTITAQRDDASLRDKIKSASDGDLSTSFNKDATDGNNLGDDGLSFFNYPENTLGRRFARSNINFIELEKNFGIPAHCPVEAAYVDWEKISLEFSSQQLTKTERIVSGECESNNKTEKQQLANQEFSQIVDDILRLEIIFQPKKDPCATVSTSMEKVSITTDDEKVHVFFTEIKACNSGDSLSQQAFANIRNLLLAQF